MFQNLSVVLSFLCEFIECSLKMYKIFQLCPFGIFISFIWALLLQMCNINLLLLLIPFLVSLICRAPGTEHRRTEEKYVPLFYSITYWTSTLEQTLFYVTVIPWERYYCFYYTKTWGSEKEPQSQDPIATPLHRIIETWTVVTHTFCKTLPSSFNLPSQWNNAGPDVENK